MTANGWIQIAIFAAILILLGAPARRLHDRRVRGPRRLSAPGRTRHLPLCGVDERQEQHWLTYGIGVLLFSVAGFVAALRAAAAAGRAAVQSGGIRTRYRRQLAFNTAVSFVTNTNWQSYGGETTMSYLVQMAGLTVHNFVSAAAGIVVAIALIRGFARRSANSIGNFWVDMTRCDALHPAADLDRRSRWCWCGRACRRTSAPIPRRRRSKAPSRSSRRARSPRRGHQDARHQWRRLLQRQLGASVREPDRADQPRSRCWR